MPFDDLSVEFVDVELELDELELDDELVGLVLTELDFFDSGFSLRVVSISSS